MFIGRFSGTLNREHFNSGAGLKLFCHQISDSTCHALGSCDFIAMQSLSDASRGVAEMANLSVQQKCVDAWCLGSFTFEYRARVFPNPLARPFEAERNKALPVRPVDQLGSLLTRPGIIHSGERGSRTNGLRLQTETLPEIAVAWTCEIRAHNPMISALCSVRSVSNAGRH